MNGGSTVQFTTAKVWPWSTIDHDLAARNVQFINAIVSWPSKASARCPLYADAFCSGSAALSRLEMGLYQI